MRERMMRFMAGRNGVDELAQAEFLAVCVLMILAVFIRPLYILSLIMLFHAYFRIFSRNTAKRYAENQKWRNFRYRLTVRRSRLRKRWEERGMYRYYRCPKCRQRVRVPSGHGRVRITCPKCREEFERRS